jgi:hypothetical protein
MAAHCLPVTDPVYVNIARNLRGMIKHLPPEATDGDLIELWQCAADMTDWELCDFIDDMIQTGLSWPDVMDVLGYCPSQPVRH